MKTRISFLALVLLASTNSAAESSGVWPQFRGPGGGGVADGQPPVEFGPDKNVKWKVSVPKGLSSPIVVRDRIVVTAFDNDKLLTIAYDRADGKEVWRAEAPVKRLEEYHKTEGSPAASTPVTDGERIVAYFGSCGLICYDLSGNELWRFEMGPLEIPGNFGSGVSPIIADGLVIIVRDQTKDSKIIAVDLATGERKWEQSRQSPVSYSTPVVWDTPQGKQVVVAGHAIMASYDLQSGQPKWFVSGTPSGCCTSPVTADGILYFAGWSPGGADDPEFQMPTFDAMLKDLDKDSDQALSREEGASYFEGFFDNQDTNKDGKITRDEWDVVLKFMTEGKNVAFALKPGGEGDITQTHMLWKQTKGLPYLPTAIVYQGQYVMVKDGGIVTAYDVTTLKQIYMERAAASDKYYASPVAANGNIYFTSLDGAVAVLKAGSEQPVVVAKNPPLGERTAATPAIVDDTIYLRTENHLIAFAQPPAKPE